MSVLGNEADELFNNEAFMQATSDYNKFIDLQWANESKAERREELWLHKQALTQVLINLQGYIDNDEYEAQLKAKAGWFK